MLRLSRTDVVMSVASGIIEAVVLVWFVHRRGWFCV